MNFFDERAKDWDADPQKVERARMTADAIRKAIPLSRNMSALEYGCGTGLLSFALQADLGEITLADTSTGMLAALAEKIRASGVENFRPLRLDLTVAPLPAQRFDLIYSLMTLHHIPNTADILQKFHALLKPGGFLLAADLDKEDGTFHAKPSGEAHLGFERGALKTKAAASGFENIQFTTAYIIRKETDAGEKSFPVFLMSAQKNR